MDASTMTGAGRHDGVPDPRPPLLCLWRAPDTPASGVGIVYVHTGAMQAVEHDPGTRALFAHLTGQGHVIVEATPSAPGDAGAPCDARRTAVDWLAAHTRELHLESDLMMVWTRN